VVNRNPVSFVIRFHSTNSDQPASLMDRARQWFLSIPPTFKSSTTMADVVVASSVVGSFSLVRTDAVTDVLSVVAIPAEDLESFRVLMLPEPIVEVPLFLPTLFMPRLHTLILHRHDIHVNDIHIPQ
jgi:hypothetical protein